MPYWSSFTEYKGNMMGTMGMTGASSGNMAKTAARTGSDVGPSMGNPGKSASRRGSDVGSSMGNMAKAPARKGGNMKGMK